MNIKFNPILFLKYLVPVALMGMFALTGCTTGYAVAHPINGALPPHTSISGPPKSQWVALYAHHPFYLRKMAFRLTHRPPVMGTEKESIDYHCLPDQAYENVLAYYVRRVFHHIGLDQGQGPAIPVDVTITRAAFDTNVWYRPWLETTVQVGDRHPLRVPLQTDSVGMVPYPGTDWDVASHFIPPMATEIAQVAKILQEGRPDRMRNGYWAQGVLPAWAAPGEAGTDEVVMISHGNMSQFGLGADSATAGTRIPDAVRERIMLHSGLTVPQMKTLCRKAEKTGKVQPWPGTSRTTAAQ